jgi:hypothetical protein
MNFNSSEARRILRLEANVRDINEKLSQLQSTNPGSTQNQMDVNSDPPIAIQASGYVPQFTVPQQALTYKQVMPLARFKADGTEFTDEEIAEHEKGRACPVTLLLSSMFERVDVSLNQSNVGRTIASNYP